MRIEYLGPDEKDESDDCAILTTGQKEFEIHIIERFDGIHIELYPIQNDEGHVRKFFAQYPIQLNTDEDNQ